MPRVAHVISSPEGVGGAERIVASLVHGALDRDWEPLVVNPFSRDPKNSALAEICEPAPYAGRPCDSYAELPGLRHWLASSLRNFRPHIVHVHLFHAGVATASLRLPGEMHTVLTHHHGDHLTYTGRRTRARLDRWAGARFERVVAISEWGRQFLLETYGYPDRRVDRIRNGWEGTPATRRATSDPPTVLCVGNFREQKGHSDLVAAFARVRTEIPAAQLVLVGEGERRSVIEREVEQLGLADSVQFRGEVQDVWPELAAADVFALASLYEPLGIAVIEAMAAGLPVVATAVGGIPELLEPNGTGLLVPPRDPAALADGLASLLKSRDLQTRLGALSRARADEMHMETTVSQYFSLYEALR